MAAPVSINQLLDEARERVKQMSPAELNAMLEAQRKSFMRGMTPCEHGVRDWETCPDCREKYVSTQKDWPIDTEDQVQALALECGWDNRRYMTPKDYTWWCEAMRKFTRLANSTQPANAMVEHMVQRFLQWKLPENFNPDGGILVVEGSTPVGTNLFDYQQATEMVRHMLEGLPASPQHANPAQVTDALDRLEATIHELAGEVAPDGPEDRAWAIINDLRSVAIGAGGQAVAEVNSPAWLAAQETLTGTCAWCRGTGSVRTRDLHDEISTERCPRCGGQGVILSALSQPHPADERVVEALEPFAEIGKQFLPGSPSDEVVLFSQNGVHLRIRHFLAARTALAKEGR